MLFLWTLTILKYSIRESEILVGEIKSLGFVGLSFEACVMCS